MITGPSELATQFEISIPIYVVLVLIKLLRRETPITPFTIRIPIVE